MSNSSPAWVVITSNNFEVFSGNKRECNGYLKQALQKGSPSGFLRIVKMSSFLRYLRTGEVPHG